MSAGRARKSEEGKASNRHPAHDENEQEERGRLERRTKEMGDRCSRWTESATTGTEKVRRDSETGRSFRAGKKGRQVLHPYPRARQIAPYKREKNNKKVRGREQLTSRSDPGGERGRGGQSRPTRKSDFATSKGGKPELLKNAEGKKGNYSRNAGKMQA